MRPRVKTVWLFVWKMILSLLANSSHSTYQLLSHRTESSLQYLLVLKFFNIQWRHLVNQVISIIVLEPKIEEQLIVQPRIDINITNQ